MAMYEKCFLPLKWDSMLAIKDFVHFLGLLALSLAKGPDLIRERKQFLLVTLCSYCWKEDL